MGWRRQIASRLAARCWLAAAGFGLAAVWAMGPAVAAEPDPVVAARVADHEVLAADVVRIVELANPQATGSARWALEAQALEAIINQRLIDHACAERGLEVTAEEVETRRQALRKQLIDRGGSWDDFLRRRHLDEAGLRQELVGQLQLEKCAATLVTPQKLSAFFQTHREEFDGRAVRVRHILLRPAGPATEASLGELMRAAAQLRTRIESGETSFEDAVRARSAGPSRRRGGDLGWVERNTPWQAPLVSAALGLQPEQISPPVLSAWGVHLIQATELREGTRDLNEVRGELVHRVAADELRQLAEEQRKKVPVEYTGQMPYRDPATGRLVPPTTAAGSAASESAVPGSAGPQAEPSGPAP